MSSFVAGCGQSAERSVLVPYTTSIIQAQETVYSLQGDTRVVIRTMIAPDSGIRQEMRLANGDTRFITVIAGGQRLSWSEPGDTPAVVRVDTPLASLIPEFQEPILGVPGLLASGHLAYHRLGTSLLDGDTVNHFSIVCDSHAADPQNSPVSLEVWISDSGRLRKQVSTTRLHRVVMYPITYDDPIPGSAFSSPDDVLLR